MSTTAALLLAAAAFLCGLGLGRRSAGADAAALRPPAPIDPKALALARQVLPREGKVGAIKTYREVTGASLRDAVRAVDTLDDVPMT
ncbi:MAG: hypothetical protein IT455_02090 [Planctomycetes bacterium]|nr:hypothetical protein [Planctomycetota bacterium]